jgi:hypothetical protein
MGARTGVGSPSEAFDPKITERERSEDRDGFSAGKKPAVAL